MFDSLKEYLYYTSSEKRGILVLSLLLVASLFVPGICRHFMQSGPDDLAALMQEAGLFIVPPFQDTLDRDSTYQRPWQGKGQDQYSGKGQKAAYQKPGFAKAEKHVIEINTADSFDLLSLPGVGPYFAKKIMGYRAKLGGFLSLGQLMEIPGMDEEKWGYIKPYLRIDTALVSKLLINSVEFKQLMKHPYGGYSAAKALIRFRQLYGKIEDLDELARSRVVPDSVFIKLKPYLSVE